MREQPGRCQVHPAVSHFLSCRRLFKNGLASVTKYQGRVVRPDADTSDNCLAIKERQMSTTARIDDESRLLLFLAVEPQKHFAGRRRRKARSLVALLVEQHRVAVGNVA